MDLTVCPECAEPAEIRWRAVMESTDGPIEHAKILCSRRHWFLLPVAALARFELAVLVEPRKELRCPADAGVHRSGTGAERL
jgi:hypothetical protein